MNITGHWYDPTQTGQGFEIHDWGDGRYVITAYFGSLLGYSSKPFWVSFQGDGFDLQGFVVKNVVFGKKNTPEMAVLGNLQLSIINGNKIAVSVTLDPQKLVPVSPAIPPTTQEFRLERLI